MDKPLYKRLYRTALVSSPIIGMYGVTPVYIFNKVPPSFILVAGLGVTMNVFVFWLLNIGIIRYFGAENKGRWYGLSYLFIVVFHTIFVVFRNVLPAPSFIDVGDLPFKKDIIIAYPFVSVLAINAIILIICNSVLTAQKNRNAELEIEQLRVTNLRAQKQVLLQQLQPHFLFNTLSVLKSLIKENPDEAENYSIKLSEFLRYSIEEHRTEVVTVEQELKFTSDYIDLQKVRFDESMVCCISIPNNVFGLYIPAFALQTLVENAIKHNSFTIKRPLTIKISYSNNAITVWNSKIAGVITQTTGTGLKNLNQRYKLITNSEIIVADKIDAFSVTVPLFKGKLA